MHQRLAETWRKPLQATNSKTLETLRSPDDALITAGRDDKYVEWGVPASGAFPRDPWGSDIIDRERQATSHALKR